jgi:hypothetical protein
VFDLVRLYAIPLAAAGLLGVVVGSVGRRSAVVAFASLAAALVFGAAALALVDTYAVGARVALWAESGLLVAAAYAGGYAVGCAAHAVLDRSTGRGGAGKSGQ